MTDRIERTTSLPEPVDVVWEAVTDPEALSGWFGAVVELDVRPGGRGVFRWSDGVQRGAVVEEVESPRRLVFRWLPFERGADGELREITPTRVEIELVENADGTLVRVVEAPAFTLTDAQASVWTVPRMDAGALRSLASTRPLASLRR